jgi:predicted alpha/beta hydrolase
MTIREIADELEKLQKELHASLTGRVVRSLVEAMRGVDNPSGALLRGWANFMRNNIVADLATNPQTRDAFKQLAKELESASTIADELAELLIVDALADVIREAELEQLVADVDGEITPH